MKTIYLDFDSVLYDSVQGWCDWVNDKLRLAIPLTKDDVKTWTTIQNVYGEWTMDFWKGDDYFNHKFHEGYSAFILGLKAFGFQIKICTSSFKENLSKKTEFILDNIKGIEGIIHSHDKFKDTYDGILVDDYTQNIYLHTFKNQKPGILFNYKNEHPWANIGIENLNLVVRQHLELNKIYYETTYEGCINTIKRFV